MEFLDKDNRRVTMSYKTNNDCPDGNHVLAIPLYKNKVYKQSRENFLKKQEAYLKR